MHKTLSFIYLQNWAEFTGWIKTGMRTTRVMSIAKINGCSVGIFSNDVSLCFTMTVYPYCSQSRGHYFLRPAWIKEGFLDSQRRMLWNKRRITLLLILNHFQSGRQKLHRSKISANSGGDEVMYSPCLDLILLFKVYRISLADYFVRFSLANHAEVALFPWQMSWPGSRYSCYSILD